MNRNNLQSLADRARSTFRNIGNKLAAGAGIASVGIGSALATTSSGLGQTAATAIDGAKSEVGLVQTALIAVVVLLVVFMFIRRSMGK